MAPLSALITDMSTPSGGGSCPPIAQKSSFAAFGSSKRTSAGRRWRAVLLTDPEQKPAIYVPEDGQMIAGIVIEERCVHRLSFPLKK